MRLSNVPSVVSDQTDEDLVAAAKLLTKRLNPILKELASRDIEIDPSFYDGYTRIELKFERVVRTEIS